MWQITNHTPFATMGYFVRDAAGAEHWVVALRATFDLTDTAILRRAESQTPVRLVPHEDPVLPDSIREEADLQPFRPFCEVLLYGEATLPDMKAAHMIPVSLQVGKLTKTLHCHAPRFIERQQSRYVRSVGDPVNCMPLGWQSALGGADMGGKTAAVHEGNPLGSGWMADWSDLEPGTALALPGIEDPSDTIVAGSAYPQPQGFGALQPFWLPRRRFAGTYDSRWEQERHPRLPVDFDTRFHQSALPDQWTENLRGGEPVEVTNVSADGPVRFRLPQMIFGVRTRIGRDDIESRLRLIGVTIDAAARQVSMIWNAAMRCKGQDTDVKQSTVRLHQISGVQA